MEKVRLGIVGVGQQGSIYGSLITGVQINAQGGMPISDIKFDQIEVGAFCDIDTNILANLKEKFPNIPVYTDYIEMMDSGNIDAVVTTLPHYFHAQVGMDALNRGLHTLLEKPAGVYTKQVAEINALSLTKPELTFGVFFNQRMNPLYRRLKEIIDNGEIGAIRRTNWIITTWYRPQAYYDMSAWRATWGGEGGGVLVNQAPHQIDLLQWMCGMPKSVVSNCKYGSHRDIAVEDEVTAIFDYGNGATGVFVTCTHDLMGTDRLEIFGDKGKIVVEGSKTAKITRLKQSEQEVNANTKDKASVFKLMMGGAMGFDSSVMETETIEFPNVWGAQHADVLKNFAANIIDKTPLVAPGTDGINGVRLANAIHLSSWLGKEVDVDFDEELFHKLLQEKAANENK